MRVTRGLSVRLLTHNIRYAAKDLFDGEHPWEVRRCKILSELRLHTLHPQDVFICLQEVLHIQLIDILLGLNKDSPKNDPDWAYIGVGRDDGKEAGEYSPIIYRPKVWTLLSWHTIWLSKTPSVPSKSWDAASIRILTTGVFHHLESNQLVVTMSTHLDDQGPLSRYHAARMIQDQIRTTAKDFELPVILAGDFNSEPEDDAYKILNDPKSSRMRDVRGDVMAAERYGHDATYVGFGKDDKASTRIDFVFVGPRQGADEWELSHSWKVKTYGVLENKFDDEIASSDHRAVVTDLTLN
ncbi:MAG: hypothetical protein M1814_004413 [Vezdaea aestivalis]|nr:MAG: hypothetical protein M1814_004413 [Vezdaea aestivalis]